MATVPKSSARNSRVKTIEDWGSPILIKRRSKAEGQPNGQLGHLGNENERPVDGAKRINRVDERGQWVHQWLGLDSLTKPALPQHIIQDADEGFAARLYVSCLRTLQQLYRRERDYSPPKQRAHVLKEELGKLYLWGEHFGAGELDEALTQSDDLKENVIELLSGIGKSMLKGKIFVTR